MQQYSLSLVSGLVAASLLVVSCGDATETALGGDPTTTLGSTTTTSTVPHRSLDQRPPLASEAPPPNQHHLQVVKSTRCDGLINEYQNAA